MNQCNFKGNFTRDPELRTTTTGVSVVDFGLAVQQPGKDKKANFFEFEAWDTGANTIAKYFKKGDPILVEASAKQDTWESDGQKRSRIKFRVNRFYFLGSRRDNVESPAEAVEPQTEAVTVPNDEEVPF